MEATQNDTEKRTGDTVRPWSFGGPSGADPREAGRRGGIQSGISRRLAPIRRLERGIDESNNGAAKAKLLEIKRREQAELVAERVRLDSEIVELYEERTEVRAQVDELNAERDRLDRRLELLHASVAAEQHELVDRLRALHDADALEPVLVALDLIDVVNDEVDDAHRAA